MKIVSLALATAVVAVIGSAPALAQSSNSDAGSTSQSGAQLSAPTHPQWARDRDWYARPGWVQGAPGYGRMGPWMMGPHARWVMGGRAGWMGHRAGWRHRHHYRPRGARFTFTRGNARVDIQCPANQSLKDCVDAASTLIDKVTRMGPPPPPPASAKPPAGRM